MSSDGETEKLERLEEDIKVYHPLQRLFLLDLLQDRDSRPTLYWALGALGVGMLVYHYIEGWSYLNALYFCVITLATIGYGDLTPTTELSRAFTIVYVVNGVVVLLALFDRIRVLRSQRLASVTRHKSR
ncbi:MAG: potassium channel family protein [Anaerolineae bacterium]